MAQDGVGSGPITGFDCSVKNGCRAAWKPVRKQPSSGNVYTMGTQYLLILASIICSSFLTLLLTLTLISLLSL